MNPKVSTQSKRNQLSNRSTIATECYETLPPTGCPHQPTTVYLPSSPRCLLTVLAFLPKLRLQLFVHLSSKFTKPSKTPTDLMVSTAYHYCLPLHSAPTVLFWLIWLSRRNCTDPVTKAWLPLIGAALVTFCEWVRHTKHTTQHQ